MKKLIILLIPIMLYGCSGDVPKELPSSPPAEMNSTEIDPATLGDGTINVTGLDLSLDSNIIETEDSIKVPINLSYNGTDPLTIKGITVYIKNMAEVADEATFENSALTEEWLSVSKLLVEEDLYKAALVSLEPLTTYGQIGSMVIKKSSLKVPTVLGREYEIYVELADGKNIFKSDSKVVSL